MIWFGEGWLVENGRFFHACGPDLRIPLRDDRALCDCGVQVPRRVTLFRAWLSGDRRPA